MKNNSHYKLRPDENTQDLFIKQPISELLDTDKEVLKKEFKAVLERLRAKSTNKAVTELLENAVQVTEGDNAAAIVDSLTNIIDQRDEVESVIDEGDSPTLQRFIRQTAPEFINDERLSRIVPWRRIDPEVFIMNREKIGDNEIKDTLWRLQYYGISLLRLSGQYPDEEILRSYFQLLGQVAGSQNDFQGDVKTIRPDPKIDPNTGDSAQDLGFHVDGTQVFDQPALLAFQYVKTADFGGISRFVDLAGVLKDMVNREDFLINLSRSDAAYFEKKNMSYSGPIFSFPDGHSLAGRLRFDAVMEVNSECKLAFEELREAINSGYEIRFKPLPGDIIVFDNWRVMHARTEIYGDSQRVHRRVWMNALHTEYQGKYLLGIRPLDAKTESKMKERNMKSI